MALHHPYYVKLLTQTLNLEKPDRLVLVTRIKRKSLYHQDLEGIQSYAFYYRAGWLNNTSVEAGRKHVYTTWTDCLQKNRNGIKDATVPCPQSIPKHPCIFSFYLAPMNSEEWISRCDWRWVSLPNHRNQAAQDSC